MKYDISKQWELIFEDNSSIFIDLPYDALIHEKRYKGCASKEESSFFPGKKYIYKKILNINKKDNKYFAIKFEGVYRDATVLFNGILLANNKYGYSEFTVDVSDYLNDKENILEVKVDNSLVPSARFYTGAGIYRPVCLIAKKENEIENIKVSTVDYNKGIINVEVCGCDDAHIEIYDDDIIVYSGNDGLINLAKPKLWDENNPNIYKLKVTTKADEEVVYFGIRDVSFINGKGLYVNGKETKLRGACIHSDNGILGAASYKEIEFNKIKKLKDAGFNAIRSSHNPCSRYILEACDYYGMYVIDELYDGWYIPKNYHDHARDFSEEEYQKDIRSMINKDFNHPSVICYSLGNEVSEVSSKKGLNILASMGEYFHKLDNTRKVTCGINLLVCVYEQLGMGIYKESKKYSPIPLKDNDNKKDRKTGSSFFNYWTQKLGNIIFIVSKSKRAEKIATQVSSKLDIIGLNYGLARYDIDYKKYPDRLMIGTETFVNDAPKNYEKMKNIPTLVGDFIWVGFDYLGEAGFGDWTYYSYDGLPLTYGSGVFDLLGNRTPLLSYLQVVWGKIDKPVISLRPVNHYNETPKVSAWKLTNSIENYNFHGYENKEMIIEVYSTYPYVKLYQNDVELGVKKTKNNIAIFKGKYQLGSLKAIALSKDKKEESCSILQSGNDNPHIKVLLSKNILTINSNDIIFGNIEIVNDENQLLPCYENEIKVETSNNINLIALGSALSNNKEDYVSNKHHAYQGRLGFAIKGTAPGKGNVIISGKGLQKNDIEINIKEDE